MNLLLLCDEYPPGRHGGIGTAVRLLARALVRRGHHVVVAGLYDWGYSGKDRFEDEGVLVYRFRYRLASPLLHGRDALPVRLAYRLLRATGLIGWDIRHSLPRYGHFLQALIREHHIDLVEMPDFQDFTPYIRRFQPFPALPVPVVVKMHGNQSYWLLEENRPVPPAIFRTEQHILQQAAALSSVSAYTASRMAAAFGCENNIEVLYNGIQLPESETAGPPRQALRVVFTGSLVAKKGIYQLMKAWNAVHAALPEAVLHVYGRGDADKCRSLLQGTAPASVRFEGHAPMESIYAALRWAAVAVFPSYAETFGMAPLEAMACGAAVIYSERTAGPEVLQHGEQGLLANPDDPAGLAEQIVYLLQHPHICRRFGAAAQERVRQLFDIDVIAGQHIAFYHRVLSGQAGVPSKAPTPSR